MAKLTGFTTLVAKWASTTVLDNILRLITPAFMRTALNDLLYTVSSYHQSVFNKAALNDLVLETDFCENEKVTVGIDDNACKSVWQYVYDRDTNTWKYIQISTITHPPVVHQKTSVSAMEAMDLIDDYDLGDYCKITYATTGWIESYVADSTDTWVKIGSWQEETTD